MDSSYPPSNFLELLQSQEDTPNPHRYTNPCVELGSSQVPLFNQTSEPRVEEGVGRSERRKWIPLEDKVLCSAWLNTSKDAVVGNEQKHNAFWKRIGAYFNASPQLKNLLDRDPGNCKQRWQKVNERVGKFVGSYESAKRQQASGQNESDVLKLAHEIFYQDYKTKFKLEHAWVELRYDQKWCSSTVKSESSSEKRKVDDPYSSSNTPCDEQESRPEGVKAAKRKGKGSMKSVSQEDGNFVSQFKLAWSIKEKDNESKERVSKLDLLHGLINKKDSLTEIEKTLKDKLINDMLK